MTDVHQWDDFTTLATEYSFEFDFLIDYLWKMERALDDLRKEEARKRKEMAPEHRRFREAFEGHKLDWVFPTSLRYSFLTLLYTHVEAKLRSACDNLAIRDSLPVRERDLRGTAVERAKKYLRSFGLVPIEHAFWEHAKEVAVIRNCIVHAGGRINNSRDHIRLEQLIRQSEHLTFALEKGSGDKYIVPSEHYSLLATQAVREELSRILNLLADPSEWDEAL